MQAKVGTSVLFVMGDDILYSTFLPLPYITKKCMVTQICKIKWTSSIIYIFLHLEMEWRHVRTINCYQLRLILLQFIGLNTVKLHCKTPVSAHSK
jgi:hypothetical protein